MAPKQGIVSILNSGSDTSIRRTLSADMSSRKWLDQNGMKRILSSHELGKFLPAPIGIDSSSSDDSEEELENTDDVWGKKSEPLDLWTSLIQSQKSGNAYSTLPTPYVTFTEKSLQVCTESLGSESGSDCFASDPPPDDRPRQQTVFKKTEEDEVRTTPPPLRSILGDGCGGDSLRIESRRENGRLVMEAVTVPPRNFFRAQRGDGRLVLSLIRTPIASDTEIEGIRQKENGYGGDEEVEAPEEKFPVERSMISPASGMIRTHKSGALMEKLLAMMNQDPTRPIEEEGELPIAKSLPLPPRVVRVMPSPKTAFEACEYIWRKRTVGFINRNYEIDGGKVVQIRNVTVTNPYLRGCKEGRIRWFGEPYCIATS